MQRKRGMKTVTSFGAVWKLSDRAFMRLCRDALASKEYDLADYGRCIGQVDFDVTEWGCDTSHGLDIHPAAEALASVQAEGKKAGAS